MIPGEYICAIRYDGGSVSAGNGGNRRTASRAVCRLKKGECMKKKMSWKIRILSALILCLAGAFGAALIQSDFGRVEVKEISVQTNAGTYTGYLFLPETATADTPAPAIVTSHGYLNNREMQDINYVELARRGYVVFAQNAYKHGDSSLADAAGASEIQVTTGGMVDAVEYLSSLNFVDSSRIGVTGHSMGGGFADATAAYYTSLEREALMAGETAEEAKAKNKVAASFIVGNYPMALAAEEDRSGQSGYLCDLGVNLGKYDEFCTMLGYKGYELTDHDITRALIAVQTGQQVTGPVTEGEFFVNQENGYQAVIYSPGEFHAMNHFSPASAGNAVTFFEQTLGAPRPLPASNQLWWLKEAFNLIGLIGFFAFVVPFAELLLKLPYFTGLRSENPLCLPELSGKKKTGYLVGNITNGIICAVLLMPAILVGFGGLVNSFWPQDTTGGIGVWSVASAVVSLIVLRVLSGPFKGRGAAFGTAIGKKQAGKTIVLALTITAGAFALVFAADYFFQTDFRIWSFDIRVFDASKIPVMLKYLPFFLIFYVVNSVCVSQNCFRGWSERRQILVSVAFNILAPLSFILVTYVPVIFTGAITWANFSNPLLAMGGALIPILAIPFVPILGIAAYYNIKLQKLTGNIWLGGLVNALWVTAVTVANTSFSYPY